MMSTIGCVRGPALFETGDRDGEIGDSLRQWMRDVTPSSVEPEPIAKMTARWQRQQK